MAKAVTKPIELTPEDEALFTSVQSRDLAPPRPKLTALLQANSAKLLEEIANSAAGDYVVPYNGEYLLFKGADGVPLTPIGFTQRFVEWGAGRSGFVDAHIQKPADAYWRDARASSDGKAGFIRESNGNRVEDTLYCHMQVYFGAAKIGATFAFRSTSRVIGGDFADRAERIKGGACTSKWRLKSHVEKSGEYRWWAPLLMLEGVLGEAGGPTLEQARLAAQLRQEFKTGSRAAEQIAAPANVTALRGHLTIESGRKPAAPIDDDIPF